MTDEFNTAESEIRPADSSEAAVPPLAEANHPEERTSAMDQAATTENRVADEEPPVAQVTAAGIADQDEASAGQSATDETPPTEVIVEATGIPTSEAAVSADTDTAANGDNEDGHTVVRMLSVGQQVKGTVKRISEFGAFVDIGVGRDGLVHISELSPRRIAKVTDMLQEGQQADFWIKKLDRDRNRISLTMIEPGMKTIRNMEKGDVVLGTVTRLMPYGAFVDIGIGRDALLHVREMGERYIARPEDVVTVGEQLEARIIDISRRRARVDLSIKGLRPEPEPEPAPHAAEKPAAAPPPEPEPEPEDIFAETEVLSPFAAALRRAEESSGVKLTLRKSNKKERRSDHSRTLQEEIMERTLSGTRK
jgi:small subunit ribosomal protein S1